MGLPSTRGSIMAKKLWGAKPDHDGVHNAFAKMESGLSTPNGRGRYGVSDVNLKPTTQMPTMGVGGTPGSAPKVGLGVGKQLTPAQEASVRKAGAASGMKRKLMAGPAEVGSKLKGMLGGS